MSPNYKMRLYMFFLLSLSLINCAPKRSTQVTEYKSGAFFVSSTASSKARWSPKMSLHIVPGAGSQLTDGRILFWSAADRMNYIPGLGKTQAAFFDPATGMSTEKEVIETGHDMFCPGTTHLADGRVLINGGKNSEKTTIYNPAKNQWLTASPMNIARGYQANTILPDGTVFTFGGSWSGNPGVAKNAEVWASNQWRTLRNVSLEPNFYAESTLLTQSDNHFWLLPMSNGRTLHVGPGTKMHWIDTEGDGDVEPLGDRADDDSAINGAVAMYDIDRVLKLGGARDYGDAYAAKVDASNSAYSIEMSGDGKIFTTKLSPMKHKRIFANTVVLPDGRVIVVGGQTKPRLFSDDNAVMTPEIWDPITRTFSELPAPPDLIARNYHSVALLLSDGRVIVGGGGMHGDSDIDHPDVQILSPPYLFTEDGRPAVRPKILSAPTSALNGERFQVSTDQRISSFVLIRLGSATHTINNDQRRIPLDFADMTNNVYQVKIPANRGIAIPGFYMLFALSSNGVPSVAKFIRVGNEVPTLPAPDQADLFVWRFQANPGMSEFKHANANFYYQVTTSPSAPNAPAGYQTDPNAQSFIFQAWSTPGAGRVPVYLCKEQNYRSYLSPKVCSSGGSSSPLFYAYSSARPGTSKVLRYVHRQWGGQLSLPSTARTRDQINGMENPNGSANWLAKVGRGPGTNTEAFHVIARDPDKNPDVFVWRYFATPGPGRPNNRSDYNYLVTGTPFPPNAPAGFIKDPTAPSFMFQAWSTPGDGRVAINLCQQRAGGRLWMGAKCEGDAPIRVLFYAYAAPMPDTVKVLHYTSNQWFGKLLIPDFPQTRTQIEALDASQGADKWTGWITRTVNRMAPFYVIANPCMMNGSCVADEPDLYVWRFYSKILPGRPNQRSDFYYLVTSTPKAPVPPNTFQTDPTATKYLFRAWSSPGKGKIPVYQCQNPFGKQYWIGNGCAGDTQLALMFYAYPQAVPNTVRALHYMSAKWFGKLVLPDTAELKGQIDALDQATPNDPWTPFINRGNIVRLNPFWVAQ